MTIRLRFAAWCAVASVVAVLVAALVALASLERASDAQIDARIDAVVADLIASRTVDAACERAREEAANQARIVSVLADGDERCRSSPTAPSPRALQVSANDAGVDADRRAAGMTWRVRTEASRSFDGVVLVADVIDETLQARADARRGIAVAMVAGALLATLIGALAARPATRRIELLVDRIRAAAGDHHGDVRVGSVGARDLDAAARAVDELLDDLRASDAARRRLFADAAHELRTPVTSIRTNAQLLERAVGLDADARDIAGRIARQSAAVGALVAGLVDHAAVDAWAGRSSDAVQLGPVVRDAVERLRQRHPDAMVELRLDDSTARIDRRLVVRAIGNLLDNAVVHGAGRILVELRDGTIAVRDEGPGIDADHVGDAFRPFARRGAQAGSGLGLAFVDHVARAHGGTARVHPGDPARIELQLPSSDSQETLGFPNGSAQVGDRSSGQPDEPEEAREPPT